MPQPKGQTGNPNGRTPGTKNKKTVQWEELGHALLTNHAERANEIMSELPPDKFIDNYIKLLEYFKPKQARTEIKEDSVQTIRFEYRYSDGNDNDSTPSPQAEGTTEQP